MAIVTFEGEERADSLFKELHFGRRTDLLLFRFCLSLDRDRQEKHTTPNAKPGQPSSEQLLTRVSIA
jgi:hypothetical protein